MLLGIELLMLMQLGSLVCLGSSAVRIQDVTIEAERIVLTVESVRPTAACPRCGRESARTHSHYQRKLADLPWHGRQVTIHWRSRRFFCDVATCPQKIFAERLPEIASAHARKSGRLLTALRALALGCGGEEGSRLAQRLGMPASPDTLLRLLRNQPMPIAPTPRVLGVDDWAFRRGQRYGTILCDLERHCVVDLLPERSAESFQAWLGAHAGVEIISRDRGDFYIKGATAGAPHATQVADRWHLLANLRMTLVRIADHHPQQLLAAARAAQLAQQTTETPSVTIEQTLPPEIVASGPIAEEHDSSRPDRRRQCYEQVMELYRQGIPQRDIARRVGIYRGTVGRYVHADRFPERARRQYSRKLDRYIDYLQRRWHEGCRNAVALTKELHAQGFKGSYYTVKRRIAAWRQDKASA
jgi:transposase